LDPLGFAKYLNNTYIHLSFIFPQAYHVGVPCLSSSLVHFKFSSSQISENYLKEEKEIKTENEKKK
jgi:hypothetical protein